MSQFNLRKKLRLSYYEIEEPNIDEYIYCSDCRDYVFEYCSLHGPLLVIPDNRVPAKPNFPSYLPRAALTIPDVFLHLAPSTIPGAGLGVFTTLTLPENVRFGPYRGKITHSVASNYCWQINDKNNKPSHMIDASDANKSNWMRYVNCSRHWCEQNLIAFQYRGQIYYRTTRVIPRFTELMVFYGIEFANKLNIDFRKYNKPHLFAEPQTKAIEKSKELEKNKNKLNTDIVSLNINREDSKSFTLPSTELKKKLKPRKNKTKKTNVSEEKNNIPKTIDTNKNNDSIKSSGSLKSTKLNHIENEKAMKIDEGKNNENRLYPVDHNMFYCDKCPYRGVARHKTLHLQMHYLATTGIQVFPCNICHFICPDKQTLDKHGKCHNGNFNCSFCNRAFTLKIDLTRHIRTHTGETPYKCNICNKAFKHKHILINHIRTHTGEKPYKCNICNKAFKHKHILINHIRIHTGEKPFKCNICNKAFSQKNYLTVHIRLHTGEKPYKCNICNKALIQKSHLTDHIRIHTGEKPYKCNICHKAFIHKIQLTKHISLHTNEI